MRKYLVIICLIIGCLGGYSQIFDMLNNELYRCRVKLISEFMSRFNGEERNPFIDSNTAEIDKINICHLFNTEYILKNGADVKNEAFQLVDSILLNNVKLKYGDSNWYAKASCVGTFKGKEISFDLFLVVEPRGADMYKWVITDVDGELFDLMPSKDSEDLMLFPNEHESDFMRLHSITNGKDDLITLYSASVNPTNRLTVFNTLVYYGFLNIEYVSDLEYTFLQVPGYAFTIKEFERESTNSGWLIHSWVGMTDEGKKHLLNNLYNGHYKDYLIRRPVSEELPKLTRVQQENNSIKLVHSFVELLDKYIVEKNTSVLDSINCLVKGRLSFRITDEICNQLANIHKIKKAKSYKLSTLITWLGQTTSPIKSVSVKNVKPLDNEFIKSKYSEDIILISGDLSTHGDLEITEQVVFFVYHEQIAGIRLISDYFK